jgi:hypothetical protein
MNKEMILGISGLGATVLVSILAVNLMSREPELKAVQQPAANAVVAENRAVSQPAVRERKQQLSVNMQHGIQNCFVSFMTTMCKIFPGQAGASLFNGTMVCPTNFPRSG